MIRKIFLFTLLLSSTQIKAQELWGAANSNYAGVTGTELNPASIVGAPFKWELNFLSLDASVMNNYIYLQRHSKAFSGGPDGEGITSDRFKDNFSKKDKKAFQNVNVTLPSFMVSNSKWGFGFHVATKEALSVTNVPYHFAKFMKEGFDYTALQQMEFTANNIGLAGMHWNEAGITGGLTLVNTEAAFITGGMTVNYLYGLNAFYMDVDKFEYNVQSDSMWHVAIKDLQYGYAIPATGNDAFKKKGSGFSTSVGMQYYRYRNDAAYDQCQKDAGKKYDYKIGVSIIDIGKVNYTKMADTYNYENISTDWYGLDTTGLSSTGNFDSLLNSHFNVNGGHSGNSFDLWLPAAASVQFDYSFTPAFYVNVSAIQRIPMGEHALKRANQLSITPRFEFKRFEIAMPYSFYDYFRHRIGLAVRFGVLTVGTDMVGPYTGISNTYGLDFYVGIRWQHFESCKKKQDRAAKEKKAECFTDF